MNLDAETRSALEALRSLLDAYAGLYAKLGTARSRRFDRYLGGGAVGEDEETLTEPVLRDIIERVLGFPRDGYVHQLGHGGAKPDFTPADLVAHQFVLDAKSSNQRLPAHEAQIRRYIDQRRLDFGVLFNLRELRVYRRGQQGHDPGLSFALQPLWELAGGEALPGAEVARFAAFREKFSHQALTLEEKIARIRRARRWADLEAAGERLEIDVDYLVARLRDLSRLLAADAAAQYDTLEGRLALNPGQERALLEELRALVLDLAPGARLEELPSAVAGFRAAPVGLAARAWRQYLLRVSQLALTRVLLYRSWEDVGFVDERLYDGRFGQLYDRLGSSVRRVLQEAFAAGRERYRWLYGEDNNYDWYRPRDAALVELLYALVPVPLGKLNADVLGGLYESYVDAIDRDRLGQFYTPRSVVRFMLDRAGFKGATGVFTVAGTERRPRRVLDFATGSGGFVVEASRRIVDEVEGGDVRDGQEGLRAIVLGISGAEISPFPYYLTEVNLLLQVSRLLGALRRHGVDPPSFVLGVVHTDTLRARTGGDVSLEGLGPADRADRAELVADERFGLVPLDAAKAEAFKRMRDDAAFDLVIGNPPYVFESGNKVLFDGLRALPAWRTTYRGKSDYLYYFLTLAAEKVAPDGRLCVITPASWMNAGNAGWLRERLAGQLRLDELFLFGAYRLFAPETLSGGERARMKPPTVESAILVATKAAVPAAHELRIVVLQDHQAVARALTGDPDARLPEHTALLDAMGARLDGRAGRSKGMLVHRLRQSALDHAVPWPIKHSERDVARRVVAHLDALLAQAGAGVEPLDKRWRIFQGVQTGADAYTERIQRRLDDGTKASLAREGRQTGEPILELPPGRERDTPWRDHGELLARSIEPRAILYGAVDDGDYTSLVWIGRDDEVPVNVERALEPWKRVLETRAEFVRNAGRRWFETAWARDKDALRGPKVIALYRTDRGRFALDETGEWQPSIKTTVCTSEEAVSVAYLCALLNSELLDLWYGVRGKTPRDVWRNYEPKPMARMPYRHVDLPAKPSRRVAALTRALARRDTLVALNHAAAIAVDLVTEPATAPEAAHALEALVRSIAVNRRALLPHRAVAPGLGATIKDPWRSGPVELDLGALVAELDQGEVIAVRIDPSLDLEILRDGALGHPRLEHATLTFARGRLVTARVTGPPERLGLVAALTASRPRVMPHELQDLLLPKRAGEFERLVEGRRTEIRDLLKEGAALVEVTERLVCRLYGVPADLELDVIAHAKDRAARSEPAAAD